MQTAFIRQRAPFPGAVLLAVLLFLSALSSTCPAVSSKIVRHSTSADLLKGETENVVIGSRGTIQLGQSADVLVEEFERVWSINSVVASGGTVYVGTSPNGGIYKYSLGKLTKIYPAESQAEPQAAPEAGDANTVEEPEHLTNEHIFAMATDVSGRLLAGMSGKHCRLCRLEKNKMEVIFEPNDAKYIFAIAVDNGGNIYVGTGPEGKIYACDPFGKKAKVLYDSVDKNILSLAAGADGCLYAGSDSRGLVYKMDPRTGKAAVLYDSQQPEVTALLYESAGSLWAAATSAQLVQTQKQFAAQLPPAGRPEVKTTQDKSPDSTEGGTRLKIANTPSSAADKPAGAPAPVRKGAKPTMASHIYRISSEGFVKDVFGENAVFLCLAPRNNALLVGTGNNAQLFNVDPASEQQSVIYEDEHAAQITAMAVTGDDVYIGMANPAKLVKLGKSVASSGHYTSDLVDADQPARWGKLQIEADIPEKCSVLVSARSGNVEDVNDPTFSDWTEPVEVTEPVQLQCPLGRFCQYKLTLRGDGTKSPVVREIAVASTVPNLAPDVESVDVSPIKAPGKDGAFKISYKAKDDNGDKLIYRIDFRKLGRAGWIELKDEVSADNFEWPGKTVEDGRYEIRVTAGDEKSNTTATKLEGSRVSEPVVIDNTGPVLKNMKITAILRNGEPQRIFKFEVSDALSAIGQLDYTVDSNSDWIGALPDDLVYDTTNEIFTLTVDTNEDMAKGDHVLAIRVSDAAGNTTYKTFEFTLE